MLAIAHDQAHDQARNKPTTKPTTKPAALDVVHNAIIQLV
jgi:hypothetical protein